MDDAFASSLQKWLEDVRAEYWEHLGQNDLEDDFQGTAYVIFKINDIVFAIDAQLCKGVVRKPRVTMLPGLPSYILGVAGISGEIISVSDPAGLLGIPGKRKKDQGYLLIIAAGTTKTALWVDKVSDLTMLGKEDVAQLGAPWPGAPEGIVTGQWSEADKAILIIDGSAYIEASAVGSKLEDG